MLEVGLNPTLFYICKTKKLQGFIVLMKIPNMYISFYI